MDFDQSGSHDATAVDQGHSHVLIGDGLNQIRFVLLILAGLSQEQLADCLLGSTAFQRARSHLRLVLKRVDGRVRSQHRDCK